MQRAVAAAVALITIGSGCLPQRFGGEGEGEGEGEFGGTTLLVERSLSLMLDARHITQRFSFAIDLEPGTTGTVQAQVVGGTAPTFAELTPEVFSTTDTTWWTPFGFGSPLQTFLGNDDVVVLGVHAPQTPTEVDIVVRLLANDDNFDGVPDASDGSIGDPTPLP